MIVLECMAETELSLNSSQRTSMSGLASLYPFVEITIYDDLHATSFLSLVPNACFFCYNVLLADRSMSLLDFDPLHHVLLIISTGILYLLILYLDYNS